MMIATRAFDVDALIRRNAMTEFSKIVFDNFTQREADDMTIRSLRATESSFAAYVEGFAAVVGDDPVKVALWTGTL